MLIITFVKSFASFNCRCHLSPYKALWGFLAFTFSEELGFGEGGHVLEFGLPFKICIWQHLGGWYTLTPLLWWIDI